MLIVPSGICLPEEVPVHSVRFSNCEKSFSFRVLRLDLIHPVYGGNKLFKLLDNVRDFLERGYDGILSFGGAFSNHIAALAAVGQQIGIPTTGIIRGEASAADNPTLKRASAMGMRLEFVNRVEYRRLRASGNTTELQRRYGNFLIVPEGGSNPSGIAGCRRIADYVPDDAKVVVMAVGTGATCVGLRQGLPPDKWIWGLKVLEARQENLWHDDPQSGIGWIDRFTFGGYAKSTAELDVFVQEWNRQTDIRIEPVYTGKLFFGVIRLMEEGILPFGEETLVIHTGGLQYLMD
ncbi:MAG: hypothetical protein RLZZ630_873 [Bacteroidota bacterium]